MVETEFLYNPQTMIIEGLKPSSSSSPGFAVNLQVVLGSPRAQFKRRGSQPGMQESDFLKQITKVGDLEPKANNCTRVSSLAYHCYRGNSFIRLKKNCPDSNTVSIG